MHILTTDFSPLKVNYKENARIAGSVPVYFSGYDLNMHRAYGSPFIAVLTNNGLKPVVTKYTEPTALRPRKNCNVLVRSYKIIVGNH